MQSHAGTGAATVGELVLHAMGDLAPAERRVARVLLASYPIAGLETVAKLASRAEVSGPTVIRFITKLGFDGYPSFQEALREEVQARISSPADLMERRPQSRSEVLVESERLATEGIRSTFELLPEAEFQSTVDLLSDPKRRIVCTGGRYSQILALSLYEHLHTIRPRVRFIGSGPVPRSDELIDLGRTHVVAVFDFRRYQQDTIDFARRAASQGSSIVLFTDPWLSPIAEVAERVLPASVEAASPFDAMVAPMALVEAVVAALLLALEDTAMVRSARLEQVRAGFTWGGEQREILEDE